MEKYDIKLLLKELKVIPQKRWGQNFLVNKNTLKKIINFSELSQSEVILEVGPGLGTLTEALQKRVKKVLAFEIDPKLTLFLKQKFANQNNVEIFHDDILKIDLPEHDKVVSNIPYSISGPLLEKLFFKIDPPKGIITIENNLAERIFYEDNYKNFSRITVSVNSFMNPIEKINISRFSFYPPPKIDLSLIKLEPRKKINSFLKKEIHIDWFLKFIAGIMPYKNKNLSNAIILFLKNLEHNEISKKAIKNILNENNYPDSKIFTYNIDQLVEISKIFYYLIEN